MDPSLSKEANVRRLFRAIAKKRQEWAKRAREERRAKLRNKAPEGDEDEEEKEPEEEEDAATEHYSDDEGRHHDDDDADDEDDDPRKRPAREDPGRGSKSGQGSKGGSDEGREDGNEDADESKDEGEGEGEEEEDDDADDAEVTLCSEGADSVHMAQKRAKLSTMNAEIARLRASLPLASKTVVH